MITEIEQAMIERIKTAVGNGSLGYKLVKVDSYGGEFSDGLEKIVRDFPAILIINNGLQHLSHSNARIKFAARFAVICCAKNLRNQSQARHGSGDKVGSYQMVMDMIMLFGNQKMGLEIDALMPQSVTALVNDKSDAQLASVYAVEFLTAFEVETQDDPNNIADFKIFHANWDVPPHGNVEPPLPADETADATDHVELETESP